MAHTLLFISGLFLTSVEISKQTSLLSTDVQCIPSLFMSAPFSTKTIQRDLHQAVCQPDRVQSPAEHPARPQAVHTASGSQQADASLPEHMNKRAETNAYTYRTLTCLGYKLQKYTECVCLTVVVALQASPEAAHPVSSSSCMAVASKGVLQT